MEPLSPSHLLKDHKVILHRGVLVCFLVIPANGKRESGTGQTPPLHSAPPKSEHPYLRGLKSEATIDLSLISYQGVCVRLSACIPEDSRPQVLLVFQALRGL